MLNPRIIAGAMSGTSADGVDIALVRIEGRGLEMSARLLQHHHVPYDPALRSAIFDCRNRSEISLATLGGMARAISLTYADAISQSLNLASLTPDDLTAIAAHGQTLFHDPPNTIQWLDPAPAGRRDQLRSDQRFSPAPTAPPAGRARRWCRLPIIFYSPIRCGIGCC